MRRRRVDRRRTGWAHASDRTRRFARSGRAGWLCTSIGTDAEDVTIRNGRVAADRRNVALDRSTGLLLLARLALAPATASTASTATTALVTPFAVRCGRLAPDNVWLCGRHIFEFIFVVAIGRVEARCCIVVLRNRTLRGTLTCATTPATASATTTATAFALSLAFAT
jgi:hypothetical protein